MKKSISLLLFITCFFILNACNQMNHQEKTAQQLNSLNAVHLYKDGTLTTKIEIPENLVNEENLQIKMNLKMKNMDHNIEGIDLNKEKNYYTAKIDLPMEGIWDIDYIYTLNENTKIDSYTEVFGQVDKNQIKDFTIDITTKPEVIQPNQEGTLNIQILDNQNKVIQHSKVSLQFDLLEKDIHFTKNIENTNGTHQFKGKLEEGIWNVTIHCLVNEKEHIQETVVLPVGTEAVKELEKESAKHNHHH
ncbi:hypothetical protein G4Z05_02700 [Bacillus thermocopriae]|uniref:YtkA-like domain-containing protein n=1 Tax=Neobacillus thermocopriae TaxID=1215031 RepID=A0A6B3TPX0_9BACI|nr:hypothetical protein [Neobacillus thermocopriae]NEX77797.1 hypothetical protein [Neobacillus thermocopriae]